MLRPTAGKDEYISLSELDSLINTWSINGSPKRVE